MSAPPQHAPLTPGQIAFLNDPVGDGLQAIEQVICHDSMIDAAALRIAWETLLNRHAVLRVCFGNNHHGDPVQVVSASSSLDWQSEDWSETPANQLEERWQTLVHNDANRGIDPARSPLWRITAVRFPNSGLRWMWTFHHALLDGRSIVPVVDELQQLLAGQSLPDLKHDIFSMGQALNERRAAAGAAGVDSYWSRQLSEPGIASYPRQATPLSDPTASTGATAMPGFELTSADNDSLHALAAQLEITPGTVVLAMWSIVLSALVDSPTVVFGTVRACRFLHGRKAPDAIGNLMNIVPFAVRLRSEEPATDLLRRIKRQQIEVRPFELGTAAEIRQAVPTFEGQLFHSSVRLDQEEADAELNARWGPGGQRRFRIRHQPGGVRLLLAGSLRPTLRLHIVGTPSAFDHEFLQSIADAAATGLHALLAHPEAPVGAIPLLAPPKLATLNRQLTGPVHELPPGELLHHAFERNAATRPDAPAIHDGDRTTTYGELNTLAQHIASRLVSLDARPGRLCAVVLPRSARLVGSMFGILKSGAAILLLDADFPTDRLARLLNAVKPTAVLIDPDLADTLRQAGCTSIPFVSPDSEKSPSTEFSPIKPDAGQLAYAVFTSGSTGEPKLIGVEHQQVVNLITHTVRYSRDDEAPRLAAWATSPAFDASIAVIFATLHRGNALVVLESLGSIDESRWFDEFTSIGGTPGQIANLVRSGKLPPNLSSVKLGAEAIPKELIRDLLARPAIRHISNSYGPSETTVFSTSHHLLGGDHGGKVDSNGGRTIGVPISNTRVSVVSPLGQPLPAGWPGELWIEGAGVTRGYLGLSGNSAPTGGFESATSNHGARRYRTGDRVVLSRHGFLEFLGRRDEQLKIRGLRFEPAEIVARLREFENVTDAHVDVRPNPADIPVLIAWVASAGPIDPVELQAFCASALPAPAVPSTWLMLPKLPRGHSGKIDKTKLPDPPAPVIPSAPATSDCPTEARLVHLWARRIALGTPTPTTNFFAAGGDSFLATQWAAAIEDEFDRRLPIGAIANMPTIRALADWLNTARESTGPARHAAESVITPLHHDGENTTLLVFPGFDGSNAVLPDYEVLGSAMRGVHAVDWYSRPRLAEDGISAGQVTAFARSAANLITETYRDRPVRLMGHCLSCALVWETAIELHQRGTVGWDLVLCDPLSASERKTYTEPHSKSKALNVYWQSWRKWIRSPDGNGFRSVAFLRDLRRHRRELAGRPPPVLPPYMCALAEAPFERTLPTDVFILRDRRERRITNLPEWQRRVAGKVELQLYRSPDHHSLKAGARVIRRALAARPIAAD